MGREKIPGKGPSKCQGPEAGYRDVLRMDGEGRSRKWVTKWGSEGGKCRRGAGSQAEPVSHRDVGRHEVGSHRKVFTEECSDWCYSLRDYRVAAI